MRYNSLSHYVHGPLAHFERVVASGDTRQHDLRGPKRGAGLQMITIALERIRASHPRLTLRAQSVIEAVFLSEGSIGSAHDVAGRLGLRSRFQLARLLRRDGLPPLHRLAEWATILSWVVTAEQTGASLCHMAFGSGRHPSACYRLVKEVTGLCWADVRSRGSRWVQRAFLRQFAQTNSRTCSS